MAKSALQKKLEERAAAKENFKLSLVKGTHDANVRQAERNISFDHIVTLVRSMSIVGQVRSIDTFSRSLKTSDNGKIAIAVAQHLYGKYRVPQYLTNSWNFVIADKHAPAANVVENWRRRRLQGIVQNNISTKEIENYCAWYTVAASGGSLWKEHTRSYTAPMNGGYMDVQMFTKKENHAFLNCPLKNANVREAIIYAIASQHDRASIGGITRLCKSKMATFQMNTGNPIEFYTRRIWREVIHFFTENELPIRELNDMLDYIQSAYARNTDYSLKGRNLHTLKRNMQDWHWELNRVKRMGDAQWPGLPVPNTTFEVPQIPDVEWTMEQITSSKMLANEGTAMHHCVYSYQSSCINGSCAIWSLKKLIKKKGYSGAVERSLTIEMNAHDGSLVQIRGFANRAAHQDEMAAVRQWASRNNFRVTSRY